jgi:hypothetical protein
MLHLHGSVWLTGNVDFLDLREFLVLFYVVKRLKEIFDDPTLSLPER